MRYSDLITEAVDTTSAAFQRWFTGSKIVDASGKPLRLFRGLYGPFAAEAEHMEARPGYAAFFTDSPHMASTYANPDPGPGGFADHPSNIGALFPVYIRATSLIEFPTRLDIFGRRVFDMFAFDDAARRLKKDQAIVVRGVVDCGPRRYFTLDPEHLAGKPADIYSVGRGTSIKSAVSNAGGFDPDNPVVTEDQS